MSRSSSLHRLQDIDLALDRARARLAEIERLMLGSTAVHTARRSHEQALAALRGGQAAVKDTERDVTTQRGKLEGAERSLYGGAVRNPKELQDLQADVESLKRHLATLEDRLLEAMLALEDLESTARQTAETLSHAEAGLLAEHASLTAEQDQLQARAETLHGEREAALAGVAEKDLALYARLRESMGGKALALLKDDSCSACGVGLSASECQIVRNSTEPVRCHQCGRILYAG